MILPRFSNKFRLSLNINVNAVFILRFLYIRIIVEQACRVLLEQDAHAKHVSEIALFVPTDIYLSLLVRHHYLLVGQNCRFKSLNVSTA